MTAHDDDTTLHWLLRGVQRLLRVLLVVSAIVTGAFLVFLGPLVVAPALVMIAAYLAVLVVNLLERTTRPGSQTAHVEPIFDDDQAATRDRTPQTHTLASPRQVESAKRPSRRRTIARAKQVTGLKVVLAVLGTLTVLSALLAAILFEWKYAAIGTFAVFAWLLFSGVPFWLAAVSEEVEQTERTLERRTGPSPR